MPRPKRTRQVHCQPRSEFFKPSGIPTRDLEQIDLALEELEALRLADLEGLDQASGAEKMEVSRATFARVLHEARRKIADALVNGKAVRIEGGAFEMAVRPFECECGCRWNEPRGSGPPDACPTCGGDDFHRTDTHHGHGHGGGHGRHRHRGG